MRVMLLINPKAGLLRGCQTPEEVKTKLAGLKFACEVTIAQDSNGISGFIENVKSAHPDLVLIAGGDGTIATVLKGLHGEELTFGLIPTGSANNICRSLGIPDELEDAVQILNAQKVAGMTIGKANGELFIESVGVGLLANIMQEVGEQDNQKEVLKVVMESLKQVAKVEPLPVSIWADSRELAVETVWLTVTNLGRAGVVEVGPDASPFESKLELVYCEPVTLPDLPAQVVAFVRGKHLKAEKFHSIKAETFHLTIPEGVVYHLDGELKRSEHILVESLPNAFQVIVP